MIERIIQYLQEWYRRRKCLRLYGLPFVPAFFDPEFKFLDNDPDSYLRGNEETIGPDGKVMP